MFDLGRFQTIGGFTSNDFKTLNRRFLPDLGFTEKIHLRLERHTSSTKVYSEEDDLKGAYWPRKRS